MKIASKINTGTAIASSTVATILAAPQVILNANPIALKKSHTARIVKIISNNVITPCFFFCLYDNSMQQKTE